MARLNVWVPDDLAARARELGLNVSALTQSALRAEVERHATDHWLDSLPAPTGRADHDAVLAALDDAREEFGTAGGR
ncbi:type II toxin-antitoxin system CcdA family antitoxin [Actinomycetospora sp. TBRC 11914]|uniref:type II toxin-antitoxin system CcdA family antitoxin n=1 Tax=Actinomycetospora sp. TBRC 11914 TaxID=2729387 RepID=UPI00145EF763|nr:type II toxin-antitoxin system CcdA family antitoxin [Actinomycetospora sp. TBRC 11914]NMO92250.1 antitoxin [Actinomycetospora sp. TBRC 11914]